jgi:hypothetical protein
MAWHGMAFEAITSDADVLRYGIELDACRAAQAMQLIPNIVRRLTIVVGGTEREAPVANRLHERSTHGIACDYSITDSAAPERWTVRKFHGCCSDAGDIRGG